MIKEKSCGTIVFRKTPTGPVYLLLKYPAGHWDFPKGHVETGETEEATALRELEEETGIIKARLLPGFREPIQYHYKKPGGTALKEVLFFLVETEKEEVLLSAEHRSYAWKYFVEAQEALTFANARSILKKAHQHVLERI